MKELVHWPLKKETLSCLLFVCESVEQIRMLCRRADEEMNPTWSRTIMAGRRGSTLGLSTEKKNPSKKSRDQFEGFFNLCMKKINAFCGAALKGHWSFSLTKKILQTGHVDFLEIYLDFLAFFLVLQRYLQISLPVEESVNIFGV